MTPAGKAHDNSHGCFCSSSMRLRSNLNIGYLGPPQSCHALRVFPAGLRFPFVQRYALRTRCCQPFLARNALAENQNQTCCDRQRCEGGERNAESHVHVVCVPGGSSCVHHLGMPRSSPPKSKDSFVRVLTKMSVHQNSASLPRRYGRTKRPRTSLQSRDVTSARPLAGYLASLNRPESY
jgi:hypothetical protein